MPTTNKENPDSRLLIRIVSVLGAIFGVVTVVFFIRSAPDRSPDTCAGPNGEALPSAACLSCHVNPHQFGTGYQMRRIDAKTRIIETLSWNAKMRRPREVVTDALGNRYGVNPLQHVVWRQSPGETQPRVIAGVLLNGRPVSGFSGDGGPAIKARLNRPSAIALDSEGRLYVADTLNNRVRRVNPDGTIETVAGNGKTGFKGDGKPATEAAVEKPLSLAFDGAGNLLIAHGNGREGRIRRVDARTQIIETIAGGGEFLAQKGDGHPAQDAILKRPVEISVDPATGDLFVAESRPALRHWNIGNCTVCHGLP